MKQVNSRYLAVMLLVALASTRQLHGADQARRKIDAERSSLSIKVYKTGFFSAFAHDHLIKASFAGGSFDDAHPQVEFTVKTREMKVTDPDVSDKDKAQIQSTMLGPKVLDVDKFPEIRFKSTKIEPNGPDKWTVVGDLTIHDQTRPVSVSVEKRGGRYFGFSQLKQTLFGIAPVSIAGGAVKVKDEIRVEFEVLGN